LFVQSVTIDNVQSISECLRLVLCSLPHTHTRTHTHTHAHTRAHTHARTHTHTHTHTYIYIYIYIYIYTNHTNCVRPNTVDKMCTINVVLAACFGCGCHHRANVSVRKIVSKYRVNQITVCLYYLSREMVTTWWLLKPKLMAKILTRIIQAVMKVLILYIPITYLFKYCTKGCVN
jgi:hypothetical protein